MAFKTLKLAKPKIKNTRIRAKSRRWKRFNYSTPYYTIVSTLDTYCSKSTKIMPNYMQLIVQSSKLPYSSHCGHNINQVQKSTTGYTYLKALADSKLTQPIRSSHDQSQSEVHRAGSTRRRTTKSRCPRA